MAPWDLADRSFVWVLMAEEAYAAEQHADKAAQEKQRRKGGRR